MSASVASRPHRRTLVSSSALDVRRHRSRRISDEEILTIGDVAALLKVKEKRRFRPFDINAWIAARVGDAKDRAEDGGGEG